MVGQSEKRELLKMKNIDGNTILHEVVASSNTKAVKILIGKLLYTGGQMMNRENHIGDSERDKILADRNKLGETLLFRAARWGKKETVVYLAGEIERVGNLHNHYKRNDKVSILHVAVIGQHFYSAIWILNKNKRLATYKDNDGKTCLHLLASMPKVFRSLPSNLPDKDETERLPSNLQNKDLEQDEPSEGLDQSERSKGIGLKMINRIWKEKKMHESAIKLADILVEMDTSWYKPPEPKESDTICLERMGEEETLKNSAASRMESPQLETPLFIAASTGIVEIVEKILALNPYAVEHINKKGQNILHVAILHRKYRVFNCVKGMYDTAQLV
ncbi:hypothetical protein DITRI_Ditri19aG0010600 [Diplodiscus trichospermus]